MRLYAALGGRMRVSVPYPCPGIGSGPPGGPNAPKVRRSTALLSPAWLEPVTGRSANESYAAESVAAALSAASRHVFPMRSASSEMRKCKLQCLLRSWEFPGSRDAVSSLLLIFLVGESVGES